MNLGDRIKQYRKAKEFTQSDLAKKIDKSIRMVQKYEANDVTPSLEVIEHIAKTLGITTNELLIDRQNDYSNFKDLADVISIYDGFTTCHGYSAATLFSLIADNKMELANELAGLLAKTQEQGGWLDEDNDLLENIRSRAGY